MESDTRSGDERMIDRRLASIRDRLEELQTMWDFACSSDAQYRAVEAEQNALKLERNRLLEIKGDLD